MRRRWPTGSSLTRAVGCTRSAPSDERTGFLSQSRSLLVAQSGGPTAVINSSLVGVVDAALQSGRFASVLGARRGIEGVLAEDFVDLGRQPRAVLDAVRRT